MKCPFVCIEYGILMTGWGGMELLELMSSHRSNHSLTVRKPKILND